ncbi:MAG: hypothetical protein HYX20_01040 [Candidatus Yanofskybacteria bacterium]|nr:hypothetical protein [Candidatus Yanofskybacteria bacterium]
MGKINKILRNSLIAGVAILVLGGVFFYFKFNLPEASAEAQMVINFENGKSRKFKGPVMADMSILEALYSSSLGGDFELRYTIQENSGVVLTKIDGTTNPGNLTWNFYLNKKSVNTADINKIKIKTGDLIEVKYE